MFRSNIPHEVGSKIHALLRDFTNVARERLQNLGFNLLLFPMFRNHNQFIGLDDSAVHVVYTTEGVTSSIVSGMISDLRKQGNLAQKQIVEACVRELGYKDEKNHLMRLLGSLERGLVFLFVCFFLKPSCPKLLQRRPLAK